MRPTMRDWGMDLAALNRNEDRPNRLVAVTLRRGQPVFDIPPDRMYRESQEQCEAEHHA
jgi:hypothetical protein